MGRQIAVCLVTSRDTGRWVLPKGWVEKRVAAHKQAAREAREEAGLVGKIERAPIGQYHYLKDGKTPCTVDVFALFVTDQLDSWKEDAERSRHWLPADVAARLVVEPELADLLSELDELLI